MIYFDKNLKPVDENGAGLGSYAKHEEPIERGPSTASLLRISGERCECGGSCVTVTIACLDCKVKADVPRVQMKTHGAECVRMGHAVTTLHPRG
jgi:hypothetical protein